MTIQNRYNPVISQEEILAILKTKPLVGHLYQKIVEYFAESLSVLRQIPGERESSVGFGEVKNSAEVYIFICVDVENVAAAIAHELLHLKLAMDGFPVRISLERADPFYKYVVRINNDLAHLIFQHEFAALGF